MAKDKVKVNQIYGKLRTMRYISKNDDPSLSRAHWVCLCSCGNESLVDSHRLKAGKAVRCSGCAKRKSGLSQRTARHKASKKVYTAWASMKNRCTNDSYHLYHRYGGRGISVCADWMSFDNFYRDMGEPPTKKHSLDRINNELGYSKENCRWADDCVQANNRVSNAFLEYCGKRMTIAEWSAEIGVGYEAIRQRIKRGLSIDLVLSGLDANVRYKYKTPNGEFKSLKDVCDSHNMARTTAYNRFNSQANDEWVKIRLNNQ